MLLSSSPVLLVVPPFLVRDLARALIALGELAAIIILNLVELWAIIALMILVVAMVASTTPDKVALRLEAGVR